MKIIFLLTLCFVGTFAAPQGQTEAITLKDLYASIAASGESRIVGGTEATSGQFPWQVAVYFTTSDGTFFCGGSLIDTQWVLTAAHCAQGAFTFTIYLGTIALNNPQLSVTTTAAIVHPNYNAGTLNNDIALIRLNSAVELSPTIQTIKLPTAGDVVGANVAVTVSGFGRVSDESNTVSNNLMFVSLTTIDNQQCAGVYGTQTIIASTVCAVGNPYHSTCNGDSGGPLVTYDTDGVATVVGVVSFVASAGCASGYPSGYVRTESYLDWIASNTGGYVARFYNENI